MESPKPVNSTNDIDLSQIEEQLKQEWIKLGKSPSELYPLFEPARLSASRAPQVPKRPHQLLSTSIIPANYLLLVARGNKKTSMGAWDKYEVVEFIKLFLNTDTATSTIQVFLKEGVTGEMLECWASHREYELTIHKVLGVPIGDTFQILNQAKLVINYYARLHFGKYLE
ncbi:hypothetical protein GCK72_022782 [Caenorhabditis remanei]|uniref:Uncharacterized protein n=1 Tax=Caenorhabditis remanei TaxID=31234 RepID=A0A6A5FV35_CAERE|nr:hypothetical protein GCK72_022782 [Caenorhabditis remanei]KAF1746329.1 hypothetical protein GCK72_022782 [Caenorhabditis remanei]